MSMLVDSHCHLDFPDFADDLDGIVARAAAAGVGRMVTISTRVRRLGALRDIAERFPDVYCSVGTHPHHADEEDDMPSEELIALTAIPRWWRSARRGSTISTTTARARRRRRGFRAHIAAARSTGLPLVIHTRDADERLRPHPRRGNGEGAVSRRAALLHRRPRAGDEGDRARAFDFVHGDPDLQEIARPARSPPNCRPTASWSRPTRRIWRPGKFRGKRNEPAYVVKSRKCWRRRAAFRSRRSRAQTTENFFRLFSKVPRRRLPRMTLPDDPRLRLVRRRAAARRSAGAPAIPPIPKTAAAAARCWSSATHPIAASRGS